MGFLTEELHKSFNMYEGFQDEVLDSAEQSLKDYENDNLDIEESLKEEVSLWDRVEDYLDESLITESSDIEKAIDKYQELLRQDIPPAKAKAIVTGKEEEVQESLTESNDVNTDKKCKYDPNSYLKKVAEQYRKAANFSLDEELTEDKLKNEYWRIQNIAMKAAVPSSALKEMLLKGNLNED